MSNTDAFSRSFSEIIEELYHSARLKTGGDEARAKRMVAAYIDSLFVQSPHVKRELNMTKRLRAARGNPPLTMIYSDVISVRASKAGMAHKCDAACKRHAHLYEHKFKRGSAVYGSAGGDSIVIKRRK